MSDILNYKVRWLTKEDLPAALAVDPGRSEADFYRFLGKKTAGTIAAFDASGQELLGYLAFRQTSQANVIAHVAVAPVHRRRGVGATLVFRLGHVKGLRARPALLALVRESNLVAQLFLKALRFTCTKILRCPFSSPAEDGYLFRWERDKG